MMIEMLIICVRVCLYIPSIDKNLSTEELALPN